MTTLRELTDVRRGLGRNQFGFNCWSLFKSEAVEQW